MWPVECSERGKVSRLLFLAGAGLLTVLSQLKFILKCILKCYTVYIEQYVYIRRIFMAL